MNSDEDAAPESLDFMLVREGYTQGNEKTVAFSVTNPDNQTTGEVVDANGNVSTVNQIPGANVLLNLTNRNDDTAPTLNVPDGRVYTLTMNGRLITHTQMLDFSTYDNDVYAAVEGFAIEPNQIDTVSIDLNTAGKVYTMTHRSTGAGAPVLAIGVVNAGADYDIRATISDNGNGQSMLMKLDNEAGTVALRSLDGTAESFEVLIDRLDDNGETSFHHNNISLPANATIYLRYGTWTTRGQAITAMLDLNSDGTIDQTFLLSDTFKMFMPIISR